MRTEDKALIRALRGERTERPPIWLMRQAGRYLPEYRATREQAGGFLDLCYTPELAAEVTLQPIRRFGFDASIVFSDILVVPHALGRKVWFEPGEGPRLDPMGLGEAPPPFEPEPFHAHLAPVYETLGRLREALPKETALIGFAGAPWTLATYMAAGRGKEDQAAARRWSFAEPDSFAALIDRLAEAVAAYLIRQVEAGAEALQIFDSWAGALTPSGLRRWSIEPTRRIVQAVKAAHPDVPVIGFPRAVGASYVDWVRGTGVDAVSLDQRVDPAWAAQAVQPLATPQGNLDPMTMVVGGDALAREADAIMEAFAGGPHVFNLGHGITPEADPANVEALVRRVQG